MKLVYFSINLQFRTTNRTCVAVQTMTASILADSQNKSTQIGSVGYEVRLEVEVAQVIRAASTNQP